MIFEYNQQPVFMKNIQIDDIGNVALRCTNEKGFDYYIIIRTYLGKTALMKFGPVFPDLDMLPNSMELSFKKFDYKENTIIKETEKFINDGRSGITEVEIISEAEAFERMPTSASFLNSL